MAVNFLKTHKVGSQKTLHDSQNSVPHHDIEEKSRDESPSNRPSSLFSSPPSSLCKSLLSPVHQACFAEPKNPFYSNNNINSESSSPISLEKGFGLENHGFSTTFPRKSLFETEMEIEKKRKEEELSSLYSPKQKQMQKQNSIEDDALQKSSNAGLVDILREVELLSHSPGRMEKFLSFQVQSEKVYFPHNTYYSTLDAKTKLRVTLFLPLYSVSHVGFVLFLHVIIIFVYYFPRCNFVPR